MRSRCKSFSVVLRRPGFGLSFASCAQTWPVATPQGLGEEHEHHGKGGPRSAESHDDRTLFVGDAALGVALRAHGAGPSAPDFLMENANKIRYKRHIVMIPT